MWPQSRYRGRQRVYLQAMRSPHIFIRKSSVQPKEILITSAKRLLPTKSAKSRHWSGDEVRPRPEPLFDLEAKLVNQCVPLAFLVLDVGGVLLRRAGHRPTAVRDQAHFHVFGVDNLA